MLVSEAIAAEVATLKSLQPQVEASSNHNHFLRRPELLQLQIRLLENVLDPIIRLTPAEIIEKFCDDDDDKYDNDVQCAAADVANWVEGTAEVPFCQPLSADYMVAA